MNLNIINKLTNYKYINIYNIYIYIYIYKYINIYIYIYIYIASSMTQMAKESYTQAVGCGFKPSPDHYK